MNWLRSFFNRGWRACRVRGGCAGAFCAQWCDDRARRRFVNDEDEGTATGPITVRAYLEVNDQLEETRQKLEESLFYLGMIKPLPAATYKQIADQNWMEAWKQHYKPILIGQRLLILPAWLESPEPKTIPIKIDPGMAFGTGTHPTTQLCLELMELSTDNYPLSTVIDVGCGSGILSIAALKLGASKVLGVDIDIESVKNSRENADTNEIGEELILGQGSVTEVLGWPISTQVCAFSGGEYSRSDLDPPLRCRSCGSDRAERRDHPERHPRSSGGICHCGW